MVGCGSFIESYPLFGFDLEHYDQLATEKLELLLSIRAQTNVIWSGSHRAALSGQGVYPRPVQNPLPVFVGVGGTPHSVVRATTLGLPVIIAIIGGQPAQFRPLADLYRQTWKRAGHTGEPFVGVHNIGFIAETNEQAAEVFWPTYRDLFGKPGCERGWPPVTRSQFEAQCSAHAALMVGDSENRGEETARPKRIVGRTRTHHDPTRPRRPGARADRPCHRTAWPPSGAAAAGVIAAVISAFQGSM